MNKKAIVLTSGGLDSTTCLAIAKSQSFDCYALSFDYDQRHRVELEAAQRVALNFGVIEHRVVKLNIGQLGGSALTDSNLDVPDYNDGTKIPVTYVPARNIIFLSYAAAWAEVLGAHDIFIGVSSIDYSHYPDCRPVFIEAFQKMLDIATKTGVEGGDSVFKIHAPLIYLSKAETVKKGLELGVNYSQTISCYRADEQGHACGRCDSCVLRKKGFAEAGVVDPTLY